MSKSWLLPGSPSVLPVAPTSPRSLCTSWNGHQKRWGIWEDAVSCPPLFWVLTPAGETAVWVARLVFKSLFFVSFFSFVLFFVILLFF